MPLLFLIPLLASGGYVANDFTDWIADDDGTPPPVANNGLLPNSGQLLTSTLILGAVGFAGVYAFKKLKKA